MSGLVSVLPSHLQLDTGVVATPLFWVNVLAAHECIGFGTEGIQPETDYYIELQ